MNLTMDSLGRFGFVSCHINGWTPPIGTVVRCDNESGIVVIYEKDENGNLFLSPSHDYIKTTTLRGPVKIQWSLLKFTKGLTLDGFYKIRYIYFSAKFRRSLKRIMSYYG